MANTKNKMKTHCPYGHPLIEGNLILSQLKLGKRSCKTCFNERNQRKRNPNGNKSPTLINKEKTHCPKGHPLTPDNLKPYELSIGKRSCLTCANERARTKYNKTENHKKSRQDWLEKNPEKQEQAEQNWRENNPDYSSNWDKKNPEKRKAINKRHNAKPERKAYQKQWNRLNPRSGTDRPLDVKESMMNTRIRLKNTCQWYGCSRTPKQMSIAVHHIFPIEEYPDLASVEQYQICYCAEHHYLWHKARGDDCQHVLKGAIKRFTYD